MSIALIGLLSPPANPSQANEPTVLTFTPSRDATARADRADRNYGFDPTLEVDGSPLKRIYLAFSVTGVGSSQVTSAKLRLYNVDGSPVGGILQPTSGGWQEGSLTWNNAPAVGTPALASLGRVAPRTWYDLDLAGTVIGEGEINLVITSGSNNGADYASREGGSTTAPQLVVTTQDLTPDNEPPSQPTGLAAVAQSAGSVALSWQASSDNVGVVAYEVERNTQPLTSVSTTQYLDTGVTGETTYQYVVIARDAAGNRSAPSQPASVSTPAGAPVLIGAGDIAACDSSGDEATAALLDGLAGTVITLGDNVYPDGTSSEFTTCYEPSWGRHRDRTMPAAGNHDYNTPGATGYYGYFGTAAGDPTRGWYAFTRGTWRIIVLNSNCSDVGGCDTGSPQDLWLRDELAAHADMNVLAYWHHPRFSSGQHGNDPRADAFWQRLYDAGADVILNGHDHDYERFAPLNPAGSLDSAFGIREFVVGTGGRGVTPAGVLQPNSQVLDTSSLGVLELTLNPDSYAWRFVPVAGGSNTDAGQASVHPAPPPDTSPPSAPTGLRAISILADAVELTWDPATDDVGVAAYEMLRGGQPLGQTATASFVDGNVLPGQTYGYSVRARDAAGNWSAESSVLWISTPAPPSTLNVQVAEDATIRPDRSTRNYGSATTVEVDASSEKDAMLAVTIGSLGGQQVVSATLYLYCVDSSDSGGEVYQTATGWNEGTVTWASAPPTQGTAVSAIGPVSSGSWYSVDLSGVINAPGSYSFRLKSSSANGADYVSSEGATSFRPVLVLGLAPG